MKHLFLTATLMMHSLPLSAQQAEPPSCIAMDAMTAELNANGGPETVSNIRGIYTIVGLAFGGERTNEKCLEAMIEMGKLTATEPAGESCEIVDTLTTAVVRELEDLGRLDSSELDRIFLNSGMQVPDLNPNGVTNEATCRRAVGPLGQYLDDLQAEAEQGFDTPGFGVWASTFKVGGVNTTLNLRAAPSANARLLTELPANARDILAIGIGCTPEMDQIAFHDASPRIKEAMVAGRWCNIQWNGYEGWVFGRYLRIQN